MCDVSLGRSAGCALALLLAACAPRAPALPDFTPYGNFGERARILELGSGVTATLVAPAQLDVRQRVDLILYALPNGNSTYETMGRRRVEDGGWRYDIQHIGAQTRALRAAGLRQAVLAYLEADTKSWPEWRRKLGYTRANAIIVAVVDELRAAIGMPPNVAVTLTGHSGGGSFAWGFMDGQAALPAWLERIAFLDSNYSFEPRHGDQIAEWLRSNRRSTLVVLAYDDREITLDGKKVVSDSGGTWRATQRMIHHLKRSFALAEDTLGEFYRYHQPQIEILLHPNPENRILHTLLVGEMNGYMHALLVRRPGYESADVVLRPSRVYDQWIDDGVALPPPDQPRIPPRSSTALTGTAFIASVAGLSRDEREAAIRRELFAGNLPGFLRVLRRIEVAATGNDGIKRTITYEVMPDYLAIGSDEDFVRMPMSPHTAQAFCDAFGFVLPTRKMVNDIWQAAPVRVEPHPLTEERESPNTFLEHHRIIEQQLERVPRGSFVAGIKKDVVVSNKLQERAARVAIFGWHYTHGEPIQPLYAGHVDWYVDYSHGIRPVRRWMHVDGVARSFEDILKHEQRHELLSDEGRITVPRYER